MLNCSTFSCLFHFTYDKCNQSNYIDITWWTYVTISVGENVLPILLSQSVQNKKIICSSARVIREWLNKMSTRLGDLSQFLYPFIRTWITNDEISVWINWNELIEVSAAFQWIANHFGWQLNEAPMLTVKCRHRTHTRTLIIYHSEVTAFKPCVLQLLLNTN